MYSLVPIIVVKSSEQKKNTFQKFEPFEKKFIPPFNYATMFFIIKTNRKWLNLRQKSVFNRKLGKLSSIACCLKAERERQRENNNTNAHNDELKR